MACIITFPSVYHAFRAKKILMDQGILVELIAIPRELSDSCEGLAASIHEESLQQAVEILGMQGVAMLKRGIQLTKMRR